MPLSANALLANDPMAMNPLLHGFHEAIIMVMMAMKWSGLRLRAKNNRRYQNNCEREKYVSHI